MLTSIVVFEANTRSSASQGKYSLNFFNYHSLPFKISVPNISQDIAGRSLVNLTKMSKDSVSKTLAVCIAMTADKVVPQQGQGSSEIYPKESNSGNKNNSNELLDTLKYTPRILLWEFNYEDFGNMRKTKDISKNQDLESNISDYISA